MLRATTVQSVFLMIVISLQRIVSEQRPPRAQLRVVFAVTVHLDAEEPLGGVAARLDGEVVAGSRAVAAVGLVLAVVLAHGDGGVPA